MKVPIAELTKALSADDIAGAWLFGSAASGTIRKGGDLDVGILFSKPPSLDRLASLRAALQLALRFEDIDLVSLNQASPILRFEALRGKRIVCRDADRCGEFASLTAREYEDEMGMVERHLRRRA